MLWVHVLQSSARRLDEVGRGAGGGELGKKQTYDKHLWESSQNKLAHVSVNKRALIWKE